MAYDYARAIKVVAPELVDALGNAKTDLSETRADLATALETLASLPPPNIIQLPRFSAAVKRVRAGTGRAIWTMVGDSLTAGLGAGTRVGTGTGSRKDAALPAHTAHMLNAAGIPARGDAFFGDGNFTPDGTFPQASIYGPAANADVEFLTDWQINGSNLSFGGHFFGAASTNNKSTFYPQYATNRFDFFVILVAGGGDLTIEDSDGTVLTTTSTAGTGMKRITVSRPGNTSGPIRFARTGTGPAYLQGIAPWSTVDYRVEVWNVGISGAQSQTLYQQTGNEFTPGKTMQHLSDADLFSIQLGQNEAAKTAAQYRADMETLIAFLKEKSAGVDIQLIKTHPVNAPSTSIAADKLAALDAIATAQGLATPVNFNTGVLVDSRDFSDLVHLSERGYRRQAGYLVRQIATRI